MEISWPVSVQHKSYLKDISEQTKILFTLKKYKGIARSGTTKTSQTNPSITKSNGWKLLINVTESSAPDVAAVPYRLPS